MALTGQERATLIASVANLAAGKKLAETVEKASDGLAAVTFAIGAESANAIPVTITARTLQNRVLDNRVSFELMVVSSTSTMAYNSIDYTIAASSGVVVEVIADKLLRVTTTAAGQAVLTFTFASTGTSFLVPILPSGELGTASGAITHV